jgi:hypothetical protein
LGIDKYLKKSLKTPFSKNLESCKLKILYKLVLVLDLSQAPKTLKGKKKARKDGL